MPILAHGGDFSWQAQGKPCVLVLQSRPFVTGARDRSCFTSKCSFRGRCGTLDMVVIVEELRFRDRCSESRLLDMWTSKCRSLRRRSTLCLTLTHSPSHSHSLSPTLTLTHTHSHFHSHSLSLTLALTLPHTHPHPHPHTHTHSPSLTHTHAHTHSHTHSPPPPPSPRSPPSPPSPLWTPMRLDL